MPTQPNSSAPTGTTPNTPNTPTPAPNIQTSPHVPHPYRGYIAATGYPQAQPYPGHAAHSQPTNAQPIESAIIYSKPIILLKDGSEVVMLEIDFLNDGAITGVSLTSKRDLSSDELLYYSDFDAVTEACKNSELDNEEGDCIHTVYFNGALAGKLYSKDLSEADAKDSYSVYLSTLAISLEQPRTMHLPNGHSAVVNPPIYHSLTHELLNTLDTDTFVNLYLRIICHISKDMVLNNECTWFSSEGRVNVWGGKEHHPVAMSSKDVSNFKRRLLAYTNQEHVSRVTLRYFDAILSVVSSDPAYQDTESSDWNCINIKDHDNTMFELEFNKINSPVELLEYMKAYNAHLANAGSMGHASPYEISSVYMPITTYLDNQLRELDIASHLRVIHKTLGYDVITLQSFAMFCAVLVSVTQINPFSQK